MTENSNCSIVIHFIFFSVSAETKMYDCVFTQDSHLRLFVCMWMDLRSVMFSPDRHFAVSDAGVGGMRVCRIYTSYHQQCIVCACVCACICEQKGCGALTMESPRLLNTWNDLEPQHSPFPWLQGRWACLYVCACVCVFVCMCVCVGEEEQWGLALCLCT